MIDTTCAPTPRQDAGNLSQLSYKSHSTDSLISVSRFGISRCILTAFRKVAFRVGLSRQPVSSRPVLWQAVSFSVCFGLLGPCFGSRSTLIRISSTLRFAACNAQRAAVRKGVTETVCLGWHKLKKQQGVYKTDNAAYARLKSVVTSSRSIHICHFKLRNRISNSSSCST